MRQIVFLSLFLLTFLISCKDKPVAQLPGETVKGKYVKNITHYTINFDDGTSYDMGEKIANKVYYLTRHGEKDTIKSNDPLLSEAGQARAIKLADIFEKTQVDALYSTMTSRTLFTVDSLADQKGLVTFPYDARDFRDLNKQLEKSLDVHRVLIVGHSNTIPVLANHLYGKEYFTQTFDESDYENLIVVIENSDSTKQLLSLKY